MAHLKAVVDGFDVNSGDFKNVFYFNSPDAPADIAASIITYVYTPLISYFVNEFNIQTITFHEWSGPSDGVWWDSTNKKPLATPPWGVGVPITLASAFIGTGTTDRLPSQMAAYIYAKTAKPHDISKKFFGDLIIGSNDDGVLNDDLRDALKDVADSWRAGLTRSAEIWGPRWGFQAITATAVSSRFGTQRRRKQGVGS